MKLIITIITLVSMNTFACKVSDIELKSTSPVTGEEFTLNVVAYENASERQVVIYPPIGNSTTLERKYAARICARGISAYILSSWTDYDEVSVTDLSVHERGMIHGLHAFETFYKYSPKETHLLGTSLGGIYVGVALGKYDAVKKGVVIASGKNLAGILATSSLPQLRSLKRKRFEYFGFESDKEYQGALDRNIVTKAENYQSNLNNKRVLLFQTNSDGVIRPEYQRELQALFDPELTYIFGTRFGHKKGIAWAYIRRKNPIVNFLTSE